MHYGKIVQVVCESKLILATNLTTSISFGVIFRRPIIPISIPQLGKNQKAEVSALARELRTPLVDGRTARWTVPEVDADAYNIFCERFIRRSASLDLPIWKVVATDLVAYTKRSHGKC